MASRPSAVKSRIVSIQYLRAIAALMVVIFHAANMVVDDLPPHLGLHIDLGQAGVDLFFVISGFIIWSIGRAEDAEPGRFLLRRAVRIFPPYWAALSVWIAVVWAGGLHWVELDPHHVALSYLLIPHWSPTHAGTFWPVLAPGWTLIFELFFYGLFAATLVFGRRVRLAVLSALVGGLVLLGLVIAPQTAAATAYTSPLMLEFLGGALVAELWRRGHGTIALGAICVLAGVLLWAVLGGMSATDQTSWSRPAIFGVSAVLIVFGFAQLEPVVPALPVLEKLGDASYVLYLLHVPVLIVLLGLWNRVPIAEGAISAMGFVLVGVAVSCALALPAHARLEKPFLRSVLTKSTGSRRAAGR